MLRDDGLAPGLIASVTESASSSGFNDCNSFACMMIILSFLFKSMIYYMGLVGRPWQIHCIYL